MFVINKIFIKIWYFFRKYHRKKFINYFKKNGVYNYIHNVNKKGLEIRYLQAGFLHKLIKKKKFRQIIEFGSGWTTIVIAHALSTLDNETGDNLCKLYVIESDIEWAEETKKNIPKHLTKYVEFIIEQPIIKNNNFRNYLEYKNLPNKNIDLVFVDGPNEKDAKGNINGIENSVINQNAIINILNYENDSKKTWYLVEQRIGCVEFLIKNLRYSYQIYYYFQNYHFLFKPVKTNFRLIEKNGFNIFNLKQTINKNLFGKKKIKTYFYRLLNF